MRGSSRGGGGVTPPIGKFTTKSLFRRYKGINYLCLIKKTLFGEAPCSGADPGIFVREGGGGGVKPSEMFDKQKKKNQKQKKTPKKNPEKGEGRAFSNNSALVW